MSARRRPWYHELVTRRKDPSYAVVLEGHCLEKMIVDDIPNEDAEAAVRSGSLVPERCETPDKLVFRRRWRSRDHLVVVARFRPTHVKVVTVYVED